MEKYLTARYTSRIPEDAKTARISATFEDGKGDDVERCEHLVIRDLRILPFLVKQSPEKFKDNPEAAKLGRIVAHAELRLRPKSWSSLNEDDGDQQGNETDMRVDPSPEEVNIKLIALIDTKVVALLGYHCKESACCELVNISTAASHLRKGLAKQSTTWIYPYCDKQQLDYKLLGSPMGRPLYKSCGIVEEGERDKAAVRVHMAEWGGHGIHEHVYSEASSKARNCMGKSESCSNTNSHLKCSPAAGCETVVQSPPSVERASARCILASPAGSGAEGVEDLQIHLSKIKTEYPRMRAIEGVEVMQEGSNDRSPREALF